MALRSNSPIVKDGIEYPFFLLNLSISPMIGTHSIGGSVAMKLTPYRVLENGTFEMLPEKAIPFSYMDVFQTDDSDLLKAVITIMGGVQQFITDKNI